MRLQDRIPKHWVVPSALAAALVAALFISPALGGPNFVTKKKVVKTIAKKSNATQVVGSAQRAVPPGGERLLLAMELAPGSYLVRSTFSLARITQGVVTCRLRIVGVAQDTSTSYAEAPAGIEEAEAVAMETAGSPDSATQAQLLCSSALSGTSVRDAEITAEKVPRLSVSGS